jgi:hypothetical protein
MRGRRHKKLAVLEHKNAFLYGFGVTFRLIILPFMRTFFLIGVEIGVGFLG